MELNPRRYADTVVLSPAGRIDHASAEDFKQALTGPLGTCAVGRDQLVLDFSGVEYISSAGLRVIMLAGKQAKAQGGTLVLAALRPVVAEIIEISRFHLIFAVSPSVREALVRISPAALAAFDRG
jgi:anti-sigma B factor antagonist/stage II sporulation protein AA (anti-sigma F factor antagonist)